MPWVGDRDIPQEHIRYKQRGDGVVRSLARRWADDDGKLKGRFCALLRDREHALAVIDQRSRDLPAAEARVGDRREALKAEVTRDEERGAPERWRVATHWYWLLIGFLFVGEFPLNAVAFRLFGEAEAVTWVLTAGLALSLIVCAHFLGVSLRHGASSRENRVLVAAFALLPILVIAVVGIVREVYLSRYGLTEGGIGALGHGVGTIVFVLINLLVFLAALGLSYFHHDPMKRSIEKLRQSVRKAQREVDKIRKALEAARGRLAEIERQLEATGADRVATLRAYTHAAMAQKDFYEELIAAYSSSNKIGVAKRIARLERQRRRAERRWQRAERRALSKGHQVQRLDHPAPAIPTVAEATASLGGLDGKRAEIAIPSEFRTESLDWNCAEVVRVPVLANAVPSGGHAQLDATAGVAAVADRPPLTSGAATAADGDQS